MPVSEAADTLLATGATDRTLVGVCTLNEAENIGALVSRLKRSIPAADILVVNDDSTDATGAIVTELSLADPSIMLTVRRNEKGLGTAIRHAMSFAIENDYTFFLNLDGDLSHDPDQLAMLFNRAKQDPPVDVVIGSRYIAGASIVGWPVRRKIMSRIVNGFARLCLRLPVNDCSGSMRCYRVATLKKIDLTQLKSSGYSVLEELLVQLNRAG